MESPLAVYICPNDIWLRIGKSAYCLYWRSEPNYPTSIALYKGRFVLDLDQIDMADKGRHVYAFESLSQYFGTTLIPIFEVALSAYP